MINKESEGIVANSYNETIRPNYEEECKRLASKNSRLLCIFEGQKKEILMLRTIKATIECIFGRKIDIGE